jgi:acyl-CoA synthetase (AMP-forming)/AMP-acid ligase II
VLNIFDFIFDNYNPENTAVIYEGRAITYYQLHEEIDKASKIIHENGISSNCRIGLMLDNSIDFIVLLMAFLKNKNLVCLLNTQNDETLLSEKLQLINNDILICEDYIEAKLSRYKSIQSIIPKKGFLNGKLLQSCLPSSPGNISPENVLIQSSSGTSGATKLAYRTYENLKTDIINIIQSLDYKKGDVVYSPVPLCHGYGLTMGVFASLKIGATLLIEKWFMLNRFIESYITYTPNILLGTPETYQLLSGSEKVTQIDFTNFKWLFSSGTPLTKEISTDFYRVAHRWIHQVYGMMETSTISVNTKPDDQNILSVGMPVQNVEAKFENDLLFVKGRSISNVYVNGEKVIDENTGWFCTKDNGYINDDGYIFITKSNKNKSDLSARKD